MRIEFPALRLKLPSLRLPAFTHFRTGPRMLVDEAVAGYVTEYREEMSFESGPAQQQFGPQQSDKNEASLQKDGGVEASGMPPKPDMDSRAKPSASGAALADLEAEYRQRLQRLEQMEMRLESQIQRLTELTAALSSAAPPTVAVVPTAYASSIEERSPGRNPAGGKALDVEVRHVVASDSITDRPQVIERIGHQMSKLRPGTRDVRER